MPLATARDVRRIATILVAFLATVGLAAVISPTACYYLETPTQQYSDATAAQALLSGDNFVAADLPHLRLPATASRIHFTHNIDTEEWWLTFAFSSEDTAGFLAGRRPLVESELRELDYYRPFWFRTWPKDASAFKPSDSWKVYVDAAGRANGCLAVDWSRHVAYAWLCRLRAT